MQNPFHETEKRKRFINICKQIEKNDSNLITCVLDNEKIDKDLIRQLSKVLPENTALKYLILNRNLINDEALKLLCISLRNHKGIQTLNLGSNLITDVGVNYICRLIEANDNIKDLNLSTKWPRPTWSRAEANKHPHITHAGAAALAKQLSSTITVNGGIMPSASGCACALTSLSLAYQHIGDVGAIDIFQALIVCHLRSLNVCGNDLTDVCCATLRNSLITKPPLETLDLSCNQIGDDGAAHIAEAISENDVISSINLDGNIIGDTGMAALLIGARKNTSLTCLSLFGNTSADNSAENLIAERQIESRGASPATRHSDMSSSDASESNRPAAILPYPRTADSSRSITPFSHRPATNLTRTSDQTNLLNVPPTPSGCGVSGRQPLLRPLRTQSVVRWLSSPSSQRKPLTVESLGARRSAADQEDHQSLLEAQNDSLDEAADHISENLRVTSSRKSRGKRAEAPPSKTMSMNRRPIGPIAEIYAIDENADEHFLPPPQHNVNFRLNTAAVEYLNGAGHVDKQEYNASFQGGVPSLPERRRGPSRPSAELGKGLGIPYIGCRGLMPVRNGFGRYRDGQHLFYLRVASDQDSPDQRPYPLLLVCLSTHSYAHELEVD